MGALRKLLALPLASPRADERLDPLARGIPRLVRRALDVVTFLGIEELPIYAETGGPGEGRFRYRPLAAALEPRMLARTAQGYEADLCLAGALASGPGEPLAIDWVLVPRNDAEPGAGAQTWRVASTPERGLAGLVQDSAAAVAERAGFDRAEAERASRGLALSASSEAIESYVLATDRLAAPDFTRASDEPYAPMALLLDALRRDPAFGLARQAAIEEARALLRSPDPHLAVEAFEALAEALPADPIPLLGLAEARAYFFEHGAAVAALERYLERDPGRATAHLRMGTIREAMGEADEAVRRYRRALELDPSLDEAAKAIARLAPPGGG